MDSEKSAIRQANRRRRRALAPAELQTAERAVVAHVHGFAPYRAADAILGYVANDGEMPTAMLLALAQRDGKAVFLPRVEGTDMAFARYDEGAPLVRGRFDIPEPTGAELNLPRFRNVTAFVPVVAYDAAGGRLGRGAGFYDRALRALRGSVCIVGLAYSWQASPRLPLDSWDIPLDFVITEEGILRCQLGGAADPPRKENGKADGLLMDDSIDCVGRRRTGVSHRLPATPAERGTGALDSGNGRPRARRSAR